VFKFSISTSWTPQSLLKKAELAQVHVLRRSGAITRTIMRRRLRSSKKTSAPGHSPHVHSKPGIKGLVRFAMEGRKSVVIGPAFDPRKQLGPRPIPFILEHGGKTVLRKQKQIVSNLGVPRVARQPKPVQRVIIKPRPFAKPTAETFAKQYPEMWRNCIR
jgi:hypothetical protein